MVFDSGVGGLSVVRQLRQQLPDTAITYLADRQGFPYGDWPAEPLADRVVSVVGRALDGQASAAPIDAIIVACNTASTVALDRLRAAFDMPIVGTVPGIKPAVAATKTGAIGLLATAGTIGRAYTDALVRAFASDATVVPVGCRHLAKLAEDRLHGKTPDLSSIAGELAPLFDRSGAPVDTVVLGCTHYPLVLDLLKAATPRPVTWIDTGPAIAQQTARVLNGADTKTPSDLPTQDIALVTATEVDPKDVTLFGSFGFAPTHILA